MMVAVFWASALLAIYPYLLYPSLLALLARLFPRGRVTADDAAVQPRVTVIVSAHNEAAVIEEKLRSTLACDYPAESLRVLVVSDASTDATDEIVTRFAAEHPQVSLLALDEHRGKTAGLNAAMELIDSELVVFTDANAIFDRDALRQLTAAFVDPGVGYVVGAQLYARSRDDAAGESEGLYWRLELRVKELESRFDSVVGGDGAIYALRSELYEPLAPIDINDFVNPLQVIARGYRGLFCPAARAFEEPANDFGKEFRRKRRIVCRTWGALLRHIHRLRPWRHARFLFMLVSHKVVRWFTLVWVAMASIANVSLVAHGASGVYTLTLVASGVFFGLAAYGWWQVQQGRSPSRLASIPYYFLLSNAAAAMGILDYAIGNRYVTWEHVRSSGA